jgi:putative FmdB family regulatory protein
MPVHTYLCQDEKCAHEFEELFLSLKDIPPETECPKCKGKAKKIPSAPAKDLSWSQWRALDN